MKCPLCGASNKKGDNYCTKCGFSFMEKSTTTKSKPTPVKSEPPTVKSKKNTTSTKPISINIKLDNNARIAVVLITVLVIVLVIASLQPGSTMLFTQ